MVRMSLNFLVLSSLLLSVSAFALPKHTVITTPWLQGASSLCETNIRKLQATDLWIGGAVGFYDAGKIFKNVYGVAQPGLSEPMKRNALFEIGSISKSFTGILLALATIEVPDLKVTDPLSKFLPEVKNTFASRLTLQQLATHTAGLEDSPQDLTTVAGFDPKNPLGNYNEAQLINYLQSAQPLPNLVDPNHPGLYLRSYSNIGFAALGLALTRIYGKDFEHLVAQKIAGPLGMKQTFVNGKGKAFPALMSKPFGIGKNAVSPMPLDIFAPAGAIISNLPDMMKYLRANIETGSDKKLSVAIKLSHQLGLGWDSFPGDQIMMKNGQTYGFSSFISFDPVTKRGSIELHNMYSIMSNWVAALPVAALAPSTDQIAKAYQQFTFDQVVNPVAAPIVASAAGNYTKISGPGGLTSISLTGQDANLIVSVNGKVQGVVLATQNRPAPYWFFEGAISLGTLTFQQDAAGKVTGLTWNATNGIGKPIGTFIFSK